MTVYLSQFMVDKNKNEIVSVGKVDDTYFLLSANFDSRCSRIDSIIGDDSDKVREAIKPYADELLDLAQYMLDQTEIK